MPIVKKSHVEFFDAAGFPAGDTRTVKLYLPRRADGSYTDTVVTASATPFNASNQDRQLRVTAVSVRSENPNPNTNDLPTVQVKVESIGPDAPQIWYLNLGFIEP